MRSQMTLTLSLAGVFAAFAALCGWAGAKPPNPAKGPRLVPYRFLMVTAALAAILCLVHAANLAGVQTGR